MRKLRILSIALLALFIAPTLTAGGYSRKGGGGLFPSLSSIWKKREKRSKDRLLRQLRTNEARAVKDQTKARVKKRPAAPRPISPVMNRPVKRPVKPPKTELPVFIPYDKIQTLDGLLQTKDSQMSLVPISALKQLKKKEEPKKEEPKNAPQPFSILDGAYYLVVEGGNTAELSGTLRVEVLQEGYVVLPLPVDSRTALGNLTLDGKPVKVAAPASNKFTDRRHVRMLLIGRGRHDISFNAHIPATMRDGEGNLSFNVLKVAMSALTIDLPGENLHIDVQPASELTKLTSAQKREKRKCQLRPTNEVTVRWYKETAKRALAALPEVGGERAPLKEEEKRPIVSGSVYNAITFADGLLSLRSHLRFDVSQAPVDSLAVKMPKTMTLLGITGPDNKPLKTFKVDKDRVTIYLQSQRQGTIKLLLRAQECLLDKITKKGTTKFLRIKLPFATALNCATANCFIGLKLGKTLQPDFADSPQFTSITHQDLPSFAPRGERKGYICYKGLREKPTDGPLVSVTEERVSSPDDFSIRQAQIDTVVTTEKMTQTKVLLTLVNSKKQYLPVQLPKGSTFQSLYVNNSPAKAGLRDPNDKAKLLVPLIKSQLRNRQWLPFQVELVYITPVTKLGNSGEVTIETIGTDETIDKLNWQIHWPPHLQFTRSDGSLEETEESWSRSGSISDTFVSGGQVNNLLGQVQSTLSYSDRPISGKDIDRMVKNKRSAEGAYPVRVYLPRTSNKKRFNGGDVDTQTELPWLKLSFVKNDYVDKMQGIIIIVMAFSLLLLLLRAAQKKSVKLPMGTIAAVTVFTAFVKSQYDSGLEALFQGVVLGLVMAFIYACFTPIRRLASAPANAVTILILFSLCVAPAMATQRPVTVVVPFAEKRLGQSLRTYDNKGFVETKLIEEANDKNKQDKPKPNDKAPTELSLRSVSIQGKISEAGVANLEVISAFTTFGKGFKKVPLIKAFGTIKKARLNTKRVAISAIEDRSYYSNERARNALIVQSLQGETNRVQRKDNPVRFYVPVEGQGEHELVLNIEMDVKDLSNSWRGLSFELPAYQERTLSLDIAKKGLKVAVPNSHSLEVKSIENKTVVHALLSGKQRVTIKWFEKVVRKRADTRKREATERPEEDIKLLHKVVKVKREPELAPLVIARLTTTATLDETHLNGTVFVEYKVEREGLEVVRIELPADLTISKIIGDRHKHYSELVQENGNTKVLAILLKRKTKGTIITGFEFKKALKTEDAVSKETRDVELDFPNFKSLDTDIDSGVVGIKRTGNLEIFQVGSAPGLEKTERERLPKAYLGYLPKDAWLVYRYRKHPWTLKLKVREHPVEVGYTASIDRAHFVTRLNRKGQGTTKVRLNVRNFGGSFLFFELAPGVKELKSVRVAGEEESLMMMRSKKMAKISLKKPTDRKDYAKDAMEISFSFKHSAIDPQTNKPVNSKNIAGKSLALYLPRLDLPVTGSGIEWEIHLTNKKHHITYLNGKFRRRRQLMKRPFKLLATEIGNRIYLRRSFLPGWPSGFDDGTANELRVDFNVHSRQFSYLLIVIAFFLSFIIFTNILLIFACADRPWYSNKQPIITVVALALLTMLELWKPGMRAPVGAGLLLSPFLFIVWYVVIRWLYATTNPDQGAVEEIEAANTNLANAEEGGEAQ